jgi:hypothetical protein
VVTVSSPEAAEVKNNLFKLPLLCTKKEMVKNTSG